MKRILTVLFILIGIFTFASPVFAQGTTQQGKEVETIILIISIVVIILSFAAIAFIYRRMRRMK